MSRARLRIACLTAALTLAAGVVAVASAAPTHVPELTNLRATPGRFCVATGGSCTHAGTIVRFHITTAARVIADIRPRFNNLHGYLMFERHFPAGDNAVQFNNAKLTPGKWRIHAQGVNSVGAGTVDVVDVHVVK